MKQKKLFGIICLLLIFQFSIVFASNNQVNSDGNSSQKVGTISNIKLVSGKKKVAISYPKAQNATKYEIYRSTKKTSGFKRVTTTSKLRFVNTGLKAQTYYYYKIRGINENAKGTFSPIKGIKTKGILVVNKGLITIEKKKTIKLKVASKKKIKWKSSNKKVVIVSKKGKITAKNKKGTSIVTAKTGNYIYKWKISVLPYNNIVDKLVYTYDWVCDDVWNHSLCDIAWYEEDGTDAFGKKMSKTTLNKRINKYHKEYKKLAKYNKFINSVKGKKFTKCKKQWAKINKKMISYEKSLSTSIPKPKSTDYSKYGSFSPLKDDLLSKYYFAIPAYK